MQATHKALEEEHSTLLASTCKSDDATCSSTTSTSESCSRCCDIDIDACATNSSSMQALRDEKLVKYGCIKIWKSQHALYKTIEPLYVRKYQEGLGHDSFDGKESTRMVLDGQEIITFASENDINH